MQPHTHKINKKMMAKNSTNNSLINNNTSVRRIQSYSPNLRGPHGSNGIQKLAEKLMDIRSLVLPTDSSKQSYVDLQKASKTASQWLNSAKEHVHLLRKYCGMGRLEITFETNNFDDTILEKGIKTVMETFVHSTKVYNGDLVASLAEISLLAFEGIFNALTLWFQPNNISIAPCWDTFGEVWQFLTYVATSFFSGQRSYQSKASYTPRLGYMFCRPLINPSWDGINTAIDNICHNKDNLSQHLSEWNKTRNVQATDICSLYTKVCNVDKKFDTKFNSFLRLLDADCNSKLRIMDAVACIYCMTITSKVESEQLGWTDHPCNYTNHPCNDVPNYNSIENNVNNNRNVNNNINYDNDNNNNNNNNNNYNDNKNNNNNFSNRNFT